MVKAYLYYLAVIVAVVVLCVLFLSSANAGVLRGNGENCSHLAKVMAETAYYKATGVTPQEIRDWMEEGIKESMGKPLSIVADDEDAKFIREMMEEVMKMQDAHGHEVIVWTVRKCMARQV